MNKKHIMITAGIVFTCLVITLLALSTDAEAKTWIVDEQGNGDFTTIQEAVDIANTSDTIRVYQGVYFENVLVNRSMTLIGNGSEKTMVNAGGNDNALKITGDHVNLSGFSFSNSEMTGTGSGIRVQGDNASIDNCSSHNNRYGIYLQSANFASVVNNSFSDNEIGIRLFFSSQHNTILNNSCANNEWGMVLHQDSDSNDIMNNSLSGDTNGILFWGSRYNRLEGNQLTGEGIDFQSLSEGESIRPANSRSFSSKTAE